jgi:asparagine synthase (glutamine-hydrolysing)
MCGIAGVISLDGPLAADQPLLERMAAALRHRGPDDSGFLRSDFAAFAFSRLSIIDLTGGNQPHSNEDGSVVSICNGEIYNHRELRHKLEGKGHVFKTRCDVEVLPHLYEEGVDSLLNAVSGQFAFAIADLKNRESILVRDHAGIAPLFYTVSRGRVAFASEIKAILECEWVSRRVDLRGLDQTITFPGLVSPRTMFEGIRALRPGHALRIRNGAVSEFQYWDLDYPELSEPPAARIEETECVAQLEALLRRAVALRLDADVPVGFYLSGGLDSSLLAGLIAREGAAEARHSFSIVFPHAEIDERRYQRLMAGHMGSIHHDTEFDATQIAAALRRAVWHAESPLKESYNTCSLALSGLVRGAGLKAVITGEGADELFAGYVGYRMGSRGAETCDEPAGPEWFLEREIRETLWSDPEFFYDRLYYQFRETKCALYSADIRACLPRFDASMEPVIDVRKLRNRHPLHQRSYVDFKLRLADHLLADHGDRVSLANSVEARYPFLDLDVLELARRLPPDLLVKQGTEKYILRQLARSYVPAEILRREKFAFVAPGSPYLLQQNIEWIEDALSPDVIRRQGYFDPETVERLKRKYRRPGAAVNTTFEDDFLMIVLTFGIFLEQFGLTSAA